MPEYLAPGVYVEEINTGPVPIEGVSTSVTGFVGATRPLLTIFMAAQVIMHQESTN